MKSYEDGTKLFSNLPVVVRVDGRSFSKFTRSMRSPYDTRFQAAMLGVVKEVLRESRARVAYTQSDEASFLFYEPDFRTELWFGGKPQKMATVVASMFTARFCRKIDHHVPAYKGTVPHFDGRAFQLPSLVETYNYLLWREQDARRNHVNVVAQQHFPHSELQGKSGDEKRRMLAQSHGVDVDADFSLHQRRGSYVLEDGSELGSFFSIKEVTENGETAKADFCRTFGLPEEFSNDGLSF